MKRIYWEDEEVFRNDDRHDSKVKEIHYYENLEIYRYNEVKKGKKFTKVNARSDNSITIYHMFSEDGSIKYCQIGGITTKEEFKALIEVYFDGMKRKDWEHFEFNVPRLMFKWLKRQLVEYGVMKDVNKKGKKCDPYFPGLYWNTWHENEELYLALTDSYKAGYMFNECNTEEVYKGIQIYDFKAFHEALMYYMEFPKAFYLTNKDTVEGLDHYYGRFSIKLRRHDDYLKQFGKLYNSSTKLLNGWFNDVDFDFLENLVGIEWYHVHRLYKIKMDRLPNSILKALQVCFFIRENEEDKIIKKFIKLGYEKFCGDAGRRRYYPSSLDYNEERQSFYDENKTKYKRINEYNFEMLDADHNNHGLDLAWNVWVNSYARQILLFLKQTYGGIYGDTDSLFTLYPKEIEFYFNDEHEKNCKEHGFNLGKFEFKGYAKEFKAVNKKQYAWKGFDSKLHYKFEVKFSGADNEIIKNYLNGDISKLATTFPAGVEPYKYIRINNEGFKEYAWRGSAEGDKTLGEDKRVIISCAGSGKTTTLVEEVKKRFKECDEPICVIAFTNKNADELRERIGINSDRLEIRTLDSLAASYLNGAIDGDKFDLKLKAATELLESGYEAVPVHLYVDEFQDLDLTKFNFINAIPCLSRFYIGDPNQSIYGYSGSINLFDKLDGFKVEKRTTNYRCAQNINDYAEGFLGEEYRPHATCLIEQGEINFIKEVPNDGSVIICRTNDQVKEMKEKFPERSITTIHKSKGLTYDSVSIVGIDTRKGGEEDNVAYVAATRARNKLNIIIRSEKYGN